MIGRYPRRLPLGHLDQAPEEATGSVLVAMFAQHRVDERAGAVDGAVEVAPATGDLYVRLVEIPGAADPTPTPRPELLRPSGANRNSHTRTVSCVTT